MGLLSRKKPLLPISTAAQTTTTTTLGLEYSTTPSSSVSSPTTPTISTSTATITTAPTTPSYSTSSNVETNQNDQLHHHLGFTGGEPVTEEDQAYYQEQQDTVQGRLDTLTVESKPVMMSSSNTIQTTRSFSVDMIDGTSTSIIPLTSEDHSIPVMLTSSPSPLPSNTAATNSNSIMSNLPASTLPPSLPAAAVAAVAATPRKTSSRYNLTDFNFLRTLGTGSFGRVHLVRSLHNSRSYAVKVLSKERVVKMKQVEHTNSERKMLERVRHPFLVNLWGTFQCQKNLYMVMDFVAGGELFSLLRKSQRFPDPVAKFFAAEVALALDYLHSLDIIYRDLKPENILLGADGHVKITDFGFAKHVPDITWTLCGTPDYLAPEIVQSRGYNKSVDWYALGVLMFEMLAGYPPFFTEDTNPMRLYEKIIINKVRYPSYFTSTAISLLRSLLTADLSKRFGNLARGSTDIFSHEWFQEVDWETLYRKEIPAPYIPKVDGEWDSSNFDSYPEVDVGDYGQAGPDEHRDLFLAF